MAGWRLKELRQSRAAAKQFLVAGEIPPEGHIIRQPELASTLEFLVQLGRDGFYSGVLAGRLLDGVRAAGGIWTEEDLKQYKVIERQPVRGKYKGLQITSAAPPSSGGVLLLMMLTTCMSLLLCQDMRIIK